MANRKRNERLFPQWDELPNGGRKYYKMVEGRVTGYARYVKEVDQDEKTVQLVQEIYDENDNLIGLHQKFPADTGHVDLEGNKE